jgi:glutathione S-transferase
MRYLGRKYGLFANDEKSLARQDLVEQQLIDIVLCLGPLLLNKDEFENNKKKLLSETLPQHLELLSKFLGKNEWLANKLTYVDFIAYETLDMFRKLSPICLDKWQNLQQFMKRFESLPPIAAYLKSKEFKSWPITGPYACWGYWQ